MRMVGRKIINVKTEAPIFRELSIIGRQIKSLRQRISREKTRKQTVLTRKNIIDLSFDLRKLLLRAVILENKIKVIRFRRKR